MALTELHVHLEGTVRRDTAVELARLHGEPEPPAYAYEDLDGFFRVYFPVAGLVRTAADFERVIFEHASVMAELDIGYAEVSFNPSLHAGLDWLEGVVRGRDRARHELGVEIRWLVELVRGADSNEAALDVALSVPGVVGLGLVGDEALAVDAIAPLAAKAHARGLRLMAHAGQTGGPEPVRQALDVLAADRIAHGVGALGDAALCDELAGRGVCLCVCPSSNAHIGLRPDYRALAAAGIPLCVNTDDPAMVDTTLRRELDIATNLGLDAGTLMANAERHRFG